MHETSLVRSLLNQVERLAEEHGGQSVKQIDVEIGPLSGVEPLLVREAFALLVADTSLVGAELVVQEVALRARCRDCCDKFELEGYRFQCPRCGSQSVRITRGDEFRLLNVTLEIPETEESAA